MRVSDGQLVKNQTDLSSPAHRTVKIKSTWLKWERSVNIILLGATTCNSSTLRRADWGEMEMSI